MAAPRGNKFALGNNGGRPPFFEKPEDLQSAIQEYFEKGIDSRRVIIGKAPNQEVREIEVPTITGLVYYIGFESRTAFYEYEKKDEFRYIIKRARLFIEKEYEEMLQVGNTVGAIFALKNMGWVDKQEVDQTNRGEMEIRVIYDDDKTQTPP